MATLIITVNYPDNLAVDIRDTLADAFEYDRLTADLNPKPSKAVFVQQVLKTYLKDLMTSTYKNQKVLQTQINEPQIE